jgi:hypothetical protein
MSRSDTGLYATIATRTSDRFPQEYLEQTVTDLKVGEHSVRAVEIFDSPLIEINDGMCPI